MSSGVETSREFARRLGHGIPPAFTGLRRGRRLCST
jgi:hypothetical protein